ncbi:hypothetical protein ElyMa_005097500 [Elysia marginata]|uniref:Par3/HAL N-terminal domain-containing protein n=1 Tax=Elysia marginata TaxID=1093978 RepID=A0AAV4JGT6_9GAST|nr:hypothetical protein ElyMa_005097500 [Elysia marginata]
MAVTRTAAVLIERKVTTFDLKKGDDLQILCGEGIRLLGHNIEQLVQGPAHQQGHNLDLVLQRNELQLPLDTQVEDKCISDHYVITVKTSIGKCSVKKTVTIKRDIKHINLENFKEDISKCLSSHSLSSIDNLNECLEGVLNEHTLMEEQTISTRPIPRWMSLKVKEAKKEKTKAEIQWENLD